MKEFALSVDKLEISLLRCSNLFACVVNVHGELHGSL